MTNNKAIKYMTIFSLVIAAIILTTGCTKKGSEQNNHTLQSNNSSTTQGINSTDSNATPSPSLSTPTPIITPEPQKKKEPKQVKAKAIYLTGWSAGNSAKIQQIIGLSKTTELNAVVIDIKDDDGKVAYDSNIKEVKDIGAWEKKYDPESVIKTLHENNIYVIGRLVCFKDPILPNKRLDLAYKSVNGGVWRDNKNRAWLNPYNKDSWDYIINIAKEAADKGFDEIQYDYIRFPNGGDGGNIKLIDFGSNFDPSTKSDTIAEFLRKSMKEIHDGKGINLAADLFAIAAVGTADDNTLGQNWEKISRESDYICPMVYPSHYASGQEIRGVKFPKPDLDPYNVVYQTLMTSKERLSKLDQKAKVRAYLQAFSAPWIGTGNWQKYGAQQIREQIKAVYDAGYEEWILWDPANAYPDGAFEKKK